jgi:hypothetical protein
LSEGFRLVNLLEQASLSENNLMHCNSYRHHRLVSIPPLPQSTIIVKANKLFARVLDILLGLHAHVEDGAISTGANDLVVHTALASLTLRPEASEADFEFGNLAQSLLVQLTETIAVVLADSAVFLIFAGQRFLAAHACFGLFGKLHQTAHGRSGNTDGSCVFTGQKLACLLLTQYGLEDTTERLGKLIIKVISGINGQVVLQDKDGILGLFVVLCTSGTLDHDIRDTITKRGSRTCITLLHTLGELDVSLLGSVVVLGQGFGDYQVGHIYFVLQQLGDSLFDETVTVSKDQEQVMVGKNLLLGTLNITIDQQHA